MGKRRKASNYSRKVQEFFFKTPMSDRQAEFLRLMEEKKWVFCSGAAGTGKTLLALQAALELYQNGDIDKIYYVRLDPERNIFGGKSLGALPGTEVEKLAPLLGPIMDNLLELCSESKAKSLIQQEKIVPVPFEYLRGRSFSHSFIIVDEAQNVPPEGILTAITRKGKNSTMVFIGDSNQKDTTGRFMDGFTDAFNRMASLSCVGFIRFGLEDVQRDEDLIEIMEAYGYNYSVA